MAAAAPESWWKHRLGCGHRWISGQVSVLIIKVSIYSICSCWLLHFLWGVGLDRLFKQPYNTCTLEEKHCAMLFLSVLMLSSNQHCKMPAIYQQNHTTFRCPPPPLCNLHQWQHQGTAEAFPSQAVLSQDVDSIGIAIPDWEHLVLFCMGGFQKRR